MSLHNEIQVGDTVPYKKNYEKELKKVNFWRASYRVDTDYLTEKDAKGQSILMTFPCEGSSEYQYRLQNTKPRNHCGGIIKKQNGFVFKAPIERPEEDVDYQEFIKDCDLAGKTMDEFMQKSLLCSQIDGYTAIVIDHTNKTGETKTLQQARADGDRYFLRLIKKESIVNATVNDDVLTEIIIRYVDEEGRDFIRYYNKTFVQDYLVDDQDKVVAAGQAVAHGYVDIPVVIHKPMFESGSQIEPIAELQQGLAQTLSYMAVEIASSVYTLHAYVGEQPEPDENGKIPNVTLGNNRVIYLGESGSLQRIGADQNASTILQTQIEKTEEAIYRTAGVVSASPFQSNAPQSGLSKMYDMADLASILTILASSCEQAENKAMQVLFETMKGLAPADAQYDRDFDLPDFMGELTELKEVLTIGIPEVVKENHVRGFVSRNYQLNEEEQARFESEMGEQEEPVVEEPEEIVED